ncbi:DUF177 domain-containing protein [Agriterribacter sp.]|uniref:YceD family protein n=1 Tax=Agriterribacter sp. TaxID=2821509 RepID=UPI002BB3A313|nr:DUF177 domain-containing protein [Agriterribacter sp.]HRP54476.1 DUF177 domain-containing protein [Agriterribacter sp.]
MINRHEYEIAFVGLKPGRHEYVYEIDDRFFAEHQPQDFTDTHVTVKLTLDKKTSFLMLKFEIGGTVTLLCDLCGNTLEKDLWDDFEVLVKMADDPDEMNASEEDPDVYYISRTESHIDVAGWIYEFINLSIPLQRTCEKKSDGSSKCNREALDMLRKLNERKTENENPIWKDLDKFRNN